MRFLERRYIIKTISLCLFITLFFFALPCNASGNARTIIATNGIETADSTFNVLITVNDQNNIRKISINCNAGCAHTKEYIEEIIDTPIAGFRIGDDSRIFFVLLTTGSGYRVLAYQLQPQGVSKVLDAGGREFRSIGFAGGHEYIELSASATSRSIYTWDGTKFSKKTPRTNRPQ